MRVSGGGGTREYDPLDCLELPGEFAKLASGDPDRVLAFVRQYGQLGYYFAGESGLESNSEERRNLRRSKYAQGDPFSWIVEHAKAVRLVLNLREAFNDRRRLRQQLQQLTQNSKDRDRPRALTFSFIKRAKLEPSVLRLELLSENDQENAIRIISEILNPNLMGTCRVIESPLQRILADWMSRRIGSEPTRRHTTPASRFRFCSLMDAIYWQLADTITEGNVKRCAYAGCGNVFITTNRKRRYCPRPLGDVGESFCSNRDRQRQYQQRLKAVQARTEAKKQRGRSEKTRHK